MPICSSGTSGPKPGVNTSIIVDPNFVKSLLPPALAWLYPFLPWMEGLAIGDVNAFCAADPPTFTMPTPLQFLNFVTGGPFGDFEIVNTFLQNLTRYYLWFQLCQCNSVATPTPTNPSQPSNMPAFPGTGSVNADPCFTYNFSHTFQAVGDTFDVLVPVPAGVTYATMDSQFDTVDDPSPDRYVANAIFFSASGGNLNTTGVFGGWNTTHMFFTHSQASVPAGAANMQMQYTVSTHSLPVARSMTGTVRLYCGTTPTGGGGTVELPCPPDPRTLATLNEILRLVTLVQREAVPFAYIRSTVHSGLTGHGEIAVQGLIGCIVQLTSYGSAVGSVDGDPATFFDAGWFNWGNADGFLPREHIKASPQVSFPAAAGQYTRIGYSLQPGVTASLTELVREP